jgi:MYXO-CTERM domain-containing protein
LALACALVAVPSAVRAAVSEDGDYAYPGIYVAERVDDAIPVRVHVVEIDLSSAEIRLRATAEAERGQKTSTWATQVGAVVAVNGDLFSPLGFQPTGLARGGGGGGQTWIGSSDDSHEGFLAFDRSAGENHVTISPPEEIVGAGQLAPAIAGVVGGRPLLVQAGVAITSFDCDDIVALPCERAPRTAAGVSADGRTLLLVVVDGWQAGSAGWTLAELAQFMAMRGARTALAFDPGGASTLTVKNRGGVVNTPSDGVERAVANQLGVEFGPLPPGTLIGFVKAKDVFSGTPIEGATVTLDDGKVQLSGADGRYSFLDRAPRYTCATASAPGYHPATACKVVLSGMMVFNSIALFPDSDFVDAGPPGPIDAGVPPSPDAGNPSDGGPGRDGALVDADGGSNGDDDGPCACRAGDRPSRPRRPGGAWALLGLGLLVQRVRKRTHQ